MFAGKGTLTAGLNVFFAEHDAIVGHVAVRFRGDLWDDSARPLNEEDDLLDWGVLTDDDPNYIKAAASFGVEWNDALAQDAALFEIEEREALSLGSDKLARYEAIFRKALNS